MARSTSPRVRRTVRSFTAEQLDRCVEIYQPLYDEPLSQEKAGEILHNVTAVYQLLATWARTEDRSEAARRGAASRREVRDACAS